MTHWAASGWVDVGSNPGCSPSTPSTMVIMPISGYADPAMVASILQLARAGGCG